MKNRSHQESKTERLTRFQSNPPQEAIETLLNSIDNFFNNEIRLTPGNIQTALLFLGIHASSLTIAYAFFDKSGVEAYRSFLEAFVDGSVKDRKFSNIADILHDWRNILAHQWIGSLGHSIEYDYDMKEGWIQTTDRTVINPAIYCECYLNAFSRGGRIWDYESIFSPIEMEEIKERIIHKFKTK